MFRPKIEVSDLPYKPASPNKSANRPRIRRSRAVAMILLCLLPAAVGWWVMHQTRATAARPCRPHAMPRVVVATAAKRLHLCREGLSEADFKVALGYAGVGKKREGDGRTPLGTYALAKARPSVSGLHRFLHIGYLPPLQHPSDSPRHRSGERADQRLAGAHGQRPQERDDVPAKTRHRTERAGQDQGLPQVPGELQRAECGQHGECEGRQRPEHPRADRDGEREAHEEQDVEHADG